MNKHICILANNMTYLNYCISNLPDNLRDIQFIIFTDTRLNDCVDQIGYIMQDLSYLIVTDKEVNDKFIRDCVNVDFVFEYTMSLNILMQWYVFKYLDVHAALFLDDDIILTTNLRHILDNATHSMFASDKLRAASDNRKVNHEKDVFLEILHTCNLQHDADIWYNKSFNGGQFILFRNQFDISEYEHCLTRFFMSNLIQNRWLNRKSHVSAFLDERFISAFCIVQDIANLELQQDVKFFNMRDDAIKDIAIRNAYKNKSILHVCNGKYKLDTFNRIINLCCKGVSDENIN